MRKICIFFIVFWAFSTGFAANSTDGGKDAEKVVKISDDFVKESGMWRFERGDWKASAGVLTQNQNSAPHIAYCLLKNPMQLRTFETKFCLEQGWQGLVFTWACSEDWSKRYEVFMFPSVIALRKFSGGNQQDAAIFRKAPSAGTWHALRIHSGADGQITVNMDGEDIIKWKDPSPFLSPGSISIGTYRDTKAGFKDFMAEGAAGGPGEVPDCIKEDFTSGEMPGFLMPYIGEWRTEKGSLKTDGDEPGPGWYICGRNQYFIRDISFSFTKSKSGGIVFLYTRNWVLSIRDNELILKHRRDAYMPWWYSLVRQVDCQAGEKHTAGLEFDTASNAVKVFWDGKVIADWENPAKEWAGVAPQYKNELEKLAAPRAVSENDAFFIHCMKTGISISGFSLSGRKCSELKIGQPHKSIGPYVSDTEFKRLAPAAPVKVGPLKNDMKGIPEIAAETALCGKYVLYCSNPVSLYFKITAPGFYTVKTEMSALKNLPQILSVGLNGTAISNELYRGLTPGMACAIIKDYVPLELSPGVYRLDLALSPELIDKCAPDLKETASRIVIDSVKIQSGLVKPEYVISAKNPQPAAAMKEPAENSELFGKDLRFILKGIVPGKYNLELGFYDVIADRPGQRLMDVFVGGRKIFGNLDVVKEAGDQKFLVKSIPVEASGGDLVIDLTGINFQAFINSIELKDGNKTIISHKPGWTPNISAPRRMRPEIPQNAVAANSIFPGINADPAKVPAPKINYFEGHNLIANPSFTFKENDGKPMWWRSVAELTDKINPDLFGGLLAGKGSYAVDGTNSFSPPSSLKIWNTDSKFALTCNFIYTNPNKRQKFSARVKTQNAKKSFLEIYWLSIDSYRYHMGSAALRVIETTRSAELSGDQPWTLLEAVAVPPPGTNMVAMMIRADSGPDGAVWVDDAAFDGYGAEPLEISYSHLGFEPSGWKSAVIRSVANKPVKIRLCRADGQIIIDKIDTELKKMHFPDRYYCEFDFSAISTPENYYLSALQEGIEVKTPVFAVKSGIYRDLTSLLLEGMRVKHFNDDTPGFHEPGWLGDFMVQKTLDRFNYPRKLSAKRYNLLKGHHDAGDRMKGYHWFPNIMFGPLNALALVKPEIKKYSANDALAELKEAADGLVNAQTEDGAFFSQIHRVYPYDNIPGFERPSYILGVIGMPQAAGALAMTAFYGGGDDPAFRKRCLDAAKRNYDFTVEGWELYGGKEAKDPVNILRYSPKIIWAALYLWKTTGDDVYKKNMDAALDALLPVLRDKAYCRSDFAKHIVTNFETCALLDFIWAPLWVVKEDPGHPKRREIEETFKIFAGEVERLSAMNPWKSAVLSPADVAEPPEYYDSTSGHMVWLALAYCLALGSDVFDDHSWAMLAERQFQWRLGRNAHDFCEVTGVGGRSIERGDFMIYDPEYFTRYLKSDRKTYSYPGMTGVGGLGRVADGSLYYNQEKRCLFGYIWGYPRGYLWRYILSSGSPLSAEYNESFLVVSGSFLSTASALSAAYDRHAIRVPDSRTAATDNRPFKQPSK